MRFSLFAVFALFSSVCLAIDEADYLPIAEGVEWIMDATITAPDGKVTTATARRKIGTTEQRDGKTYHRSFTSVDGPNPWSTTKLTRKDQTGFYSIDPSEPNPKEQTEVLFPMKVGQTWKKPFGPITVTDTILGIESVTVNGKSYDNCIHIQTTSPDGSFTEDYWEAPKVGSVKSVMAYGNGGRIVLTVREFKPGKSG